MHRAEEPAAPAKAVVADNAELVEASRACCTYGTAAPVFVPSFHPVNAARLGRFVHQCELYVGRTLLVKACP